MFIILSVLATGWFWVLFYPLLMDEVSLTTQVMHHSIQYLYDDLAIYNFIPKTLLRVLYFLSVALPPLLGSESWGRIPGLVLGASAVFAAVVYHYAFVSVWCFFAAVLASYLCYVFYRLPRPDARVAGAMQAQPPGFQRMRLVAEFALAHQEIVENQPKYTRDPGSAEHGVQRAFAPW